MKSRRADTERLSIIDTLGPFFINSDDQSMINWSKVVFSKLEKNGRLSIQTQHDIVSRFETYIQRVSKLGYNSISIDDLAHMTQFSFYSDDLQLLLSDYAALYTKLFSIAKHYNMRIFVNTDYLFFNDAIATHLESSAQSTDEFYVTALEKVLDTFPDIDGVILRVGEKDGTDVADHFLSQLLLRTPKQANELLKKILPLFEKRHKTLIFRTWTIGAYRIGDLIWNEKTFDAVFSSISSNALIISMKYGDTDFMRYLTLNPLFAKSSHKKIVELQTRREWEGMGTYPSFVGWDYAAILKELAANPTVIGTHVWCQTGGWAHSAWTNLTYLDGSSFWNELNTDVTAYIAHGNRTVEQAVEQFCKEHAIRDTKKFIVLLQHSEIAIKKGLYVADLAQKEFYFRRSRIPPLMWLTWDRIHLPPAVVHLHRVLISSPEVFIKDGQKAVRAAVAMVKIGRELQLPAAVQQSLKFELATLRIFMELRQYITGSIDNEQLASLNTNIVQYQHQYPEHYHIPRLNPVARKRIPRSFLSPFVREASRYRKRDKIFIKTSPVQARMVRYYLRKSRSHLENQSMGFETLFK